MLVLIYTKFSEKHKNEILELEEKLSNPNLTSSKLEKCIKHGIKIAQKLSKIWVSGDLFDKHKLQHLLFPDGFAYDKQNKRVLTFRTNVFFELIRSISTDLSGIKNGDSINIDQISARVTSEVEKSNFYKDLEGVIDWKESEIKSETAQLLRR